MPSSTNVKLVVLWEHELRVAAHAVSRLHEVFNDETSSEESRGAVVEALIAAATMALNGAQDENAALVLSSVPRLAAASHNSGIVEP